MPLDPERVQAVFLAALECDDPAGRAVMLDRKFSSKGELRRQVESRRRAHDGSLEPTSVGPAGQAMTALSEPDEGGDAAS